MQQVHWTLYSGEVASGKVGLFPIRIIRMGVILLYRRSCRRIARERFKIVGS